MIRFVASQCVRLGFCKNCERTEVGNEISGREPSAAHANDPTISLYGMFCILATRRGVEGDWSVDRMVPGSMGVETGFALDNSKRSTRESMYVHCEIDNVHAVLLYLTLCPSNHFISLRSDTSKRSLNLSFTQWIVSIVSPVSAMSSIETETTDDNSALSLKKTA